MTASAEGDTGVVRPAAARVVRPEWAARAVAPLVEQTPESLLRDRSADPPATAYEEHGAAFYVYRMRRGPDQHVGVVADVRLDAFAVGDVRGHESVNQQRVDALVRHYAELPVHSEPVALLHEFGARALASIERVCRSEPLVQVPGPDGVEHTVWRVTGVEETADLAGTLGRGTLYIADGHHRAAARLHTWDRSGRAAGAGVLCAVFPMDGLRLSAFHRRVAGTVDPVTLLALAAAAFSVRDLPAPDRAHGIALYTDGRWYDLDRSGSLPEEAHSLDVAVLHTSVLGPGLGITDPGHPRLEVVPAHVPLSASTARCDEDGGALFVLRPPSLRTITGMADLGQVLPPKTTYFSPKPCRGIFLAD